MTNVYWMHMPRNASRPQPEDVNASNSNTSPETYSPNESSSASTSQPPSKLFKTIL